MRANRAATTKQQNMSGSNGAEEGEELEQHGMPGTNEVEEGDELE